MGCKGKFKVLYLQHIANVPTVDDKSPGFECFLSQLSENGVKIFQYSFQWFI